MARDPASSCVRRSSSLLRGAHLLLGALAREQDTVCILESDGAEELLFVVRHQRAPITSAASAVPSTREWIFANAVSRLVDVSSLNGENPQSSVVPSCSSGMYSRGFQGSIPDFFRCLDAPVDGGDDADEDSLVRRHVPPDDPQHPGAVLLARERDVEVPHLQLEQAGQQLLVVDVRAVRRIAVAARAGMDSDALALLGGEPGQRQVVEVDEAVEQMSGTVHLHREAAFREVDLHLVSARVQTAADLGFVLGQQVVDELLARVAGDPAGRIHEAQGGR